MAPPNFTEAIRTSSIPFRVHLVIFDFTAILVISPPPRSDLCTVRRKICVYQVRHLPDSLSQQDFNDKDVERSHLCNLVRGVSSYTYYQDGSASPRRHSSGQSPAPRHTAAGHSITTSALVMQTQSRRSLGCRLCISSESDVATERAKKASSMRGKAGECQAGIRVSSLSFD